eukprot:1137739-Pyramimonas_sp.AAC.1
MPDQCWTSIRNDVLATTSAVKYKRAGARSNDPPDHSELQAIMNVGSFIRGEGLGAHCVSDASL